MPAYRIIPIDSSLDPIEIDGIDGSSALEAAENMDVKEADVWQAGKYSFSVRKRSHVGPFWEIFGRKDAMQSTPGEGVS